jgi:hypothetical protein
MANTLAYSVTTSAPKEKSFIAMANTLAYSVTTSVVKNRSFIAKTL